MKTFGAKVRAYRSRLGLSQRTFADRVHLSPSLLNRIEKGTRKPNTTQIVLNLIQALHLTPSEAVDLVQSESLPAFMREGVMEALTSNNQLALEESSVTNTLIQEAQLRQIVQQLEQARNMVKESIHLLQEFTQPSQSISEDALWDLERIKNLAVAVEEYIAQRSSSSKEKKMFNPYNYPPVSLAQAEAHLEGDRGKCPAWYLSTRGIIEAANLLSYDLWEALEADDAVINKNTLLGYNVFEIYIRNENFNRIAPPEKITDMLFTKIIVEKALEPYFEPHVVAAFRRKIAQNPLLQLIYSLAEGSLDKEWFYTLKIRPPVRNSSSQQLKDYLKFDVSVERVEENNEHIGYIVTCRPANPYTSNYIKQRYQRLIDIYGKKEFIQQQFPYNPAFTYDEFFFITDENEAHKKMLQELACEWGVPEVSAERMHYIELLYSPPVKLSMEAKGLWRPSLVRVIGAFKTNMYRVLGEDLGKADKFKEILQRLSKLEEFPELFEHSPAIRLPDAYENPKPACEIEMKYSPGSNSTLRFSSQVQFAQADFPRNRTILIPANDEAKAALYRWSRPSQGIPVLGAKAKQRTPNFVLPIGTRSF